MSSAWMKARPTCRPPRTSSLPWPARLLPATTHSYQPHRGPKRCVRPGPACTAVFTASAWIRTMKSSRCWARRRGFFIFPQAFLNPGDVVLIPDPGYITYTRGALFCGAEPYFMPLRPENDFLPDLQAIPPSVVRRARLLWLNYPNNPTAAVAPPEFFAEAVAFARQHDLLLCHDAPYTQVTFGGYRAPSLLEVAGRQRGGGRVQLALQIAQHGRLAGRRPGGERPGAQDLFHLEDQRRQQPLSAHPGGRHRSHDRRPGLAGRTQRGLPPAAGLVVQAVNALGLPAELPQASLYVWCPVPAGWTCLISSNFILERRTSA